MRNPSTAGGSRLGEALLVTVLGVVALVLVHARRPLGSAGLPSDFAVGRARVIPEPYYQILLVASAIVAGVGAVLTGVELRRRWSEEERGSGESPGDTGG